MMYGIYVYKDDNFDRLPTTEDVGVESFDYYLKARQFGGRLAGSHERVVLWGVERVFQENGVYTFFNSGDGEPGIGWFGGWNIDKAPWEEPAFSIRDLREVTPILTMGVAR